MSKTGGVQAGWRRDGKELFFMGDAGFGGLPSDVIAVEVNTSNTDAFRAGVPQKLFTVVPAAVANGRNSHPDGQRFLVVSNPAATVVPPVTVIVNWLEGLNTRRRRTP